MRCLGKAACCKKLTIFLLMTFALLPSVSLAATSAGFVAGDVRINLDEDGFVTELLGPGDVDYSPPGDYSPLLKFVVADSSSSDLDTAETYNPSEIAYANGVYTLDYQHGLSAQVSIVELADYATLELISVTKPSDKDVRVAVWGPYETTIINQVADTVGVVYTRDFALGFQGANEKTIAGFPYEYPDLGYDYWTIQPGHRSRVARNHYAGSAARITNFGSVLQAFTRDFSVQRRGGGLIYSGGSTNRVVTAVAGDLGSMVGSKIAVFGVARQGEAAFGKSRRDVLKREILDVIRQIELAEGLPFVTQDGGLWAKVAEGSKERYMGPGDLAGSNVGANAGYALQGGISSLYDWTWLNGVFAGGYPFNIHPDYGGTVQDLSQAVETANSAGVKLGTHLLSGFVYGPATRPLSAQSEPIDAVIANHPDRLLERGRSTLKNSITSSQTEDILISGDHLTDLDHFNIFSRACWGCDHLTAFAFMNVGREIIAYESIVADGADYKLGGVVRGMFRTATTAHGAGATARALGYSGGFNSFNLNMEWAGEAGRTLAERINQTGLGFISLDGVEGFSNDAHGLISKNLFYKGLYDNLTNRELSSEASVLSQYNWHFHNRLSWGEGGGHVLQLQTRYRFANSVYFARNFLPASMAGYGWGGGDDNGSEEMHWLGSKIAAMDAQAFVRTRGSSAADLGAELGILKRWIRATEAGAFSDKDRMLMQPWNTSARLDNVDADRSWKLSSQALTIDFDSDRKVAGSSFGSLNQVRYITRPWAGWPTRNIAPDAQVHTSTIRDNSFHGDNAVDGFSGIDRDEVWNSTPGTSEWQASSSDDDPWIVLTWDTLQRVQGVILFDLASVNDNVNRAVIKWEGGERVVTDLPNNSQPFYVPLPDVATAWLEVSILSSDGRAGLSELAVIGRTSDNTLGNLATYGVVVSGEGKARPRVVDGVVKSHYPNFADLGGGLKSVIIDLGDTYMVDGINAWRFWDDGRTYHDVIYQLSTTADFSSEVTTVFNNDADNSAGFGVGTDDEYPETSDGKPVFFSPVAARYVRIWSNGSTANVGNHVVEVEVYGKMNLASGLIPTTNGNDANGDRVTDGVISANRFWEVGTGLQYAQLDLGVGSLIDSVRVWHYFGDERRYHDVIVQLSNDASFNSGVTTVFNNDLDNSAMLGAGSDGEYPERRSGKLIEFSPVSARYIRLYSNGNTKNRSNHYTEIQVGKATTSASLQGEVVTPTAITQTAGDHFGKYVPGNLIDGSGLSYSPLTVANIRSVTADGAEPNSSWVTDSQGSPTYFDEISNPDPRFELTLQDLYDLESIVIWGYGNANEASDFVVEFSANNGRSWYASETVQTNQILRRGPAVLPFSTRRSANKVRVTITNNAIGRGFSRSGGDRVGFNELRFIGHLYDRSKGTPAGATIAAPALTLRHASVIGNTVTLTYDELLDMDSASAASAFTVASDTGSALTVTGVTVFGTTVVLTLDRVVGVSETVTVSYTAPPTNPVWGESGNAASPLADQAVTHDLDGFGYVGATGTTISIGDLMVAMSGTGRIESLIGTDSVDYLAPGHRPALLKLIVADSAADAPGAARQLMPEWVGLLEGGRFVFGYGEGIQATVRVVEHVGYASFELVSIVNPRDRDVRVAMWGPYALTIDGQVADVAGVAYSRDFAIGIQAANAKTFGGAPYEFTDGSNVSPFDLSAYAPRATRGSGIGGDRVALNTYWRSAARPTTFGSVLQAYSRNYRTVDRTMKVATIDGLNDARFVEGIRDSNHALYSEAGLEGSKIALFGVRRRGREGGGLNRREVFKKEILEAIHGIELGEGLPYTTGDGGVWAKLAEDSKQRVFRQGRISSEPARARDEARQALSAGADSLYVWSNPAGVFAHGGSAYPVHSDYGGSLETLNAAIGALQAEGVRFGNHVLPGFAYIGVAGKTLEGGPLSTTHVPTDGAIATDASKLLGNARTTITQDLTETQTDSVWLAGNLDSFDRFKAYPWHPPTPNTEVSFAQIGDEIIGYTGIDAGDDGPSFRLTGVVRGVYTTPRQAHAAGTTIRRLAYSTCCLPGAFGWGDDFVLEQARAVAKSINDTGTDFISLDGIENYDLGVRSEFTLNAFYKQLFDALDSRELSSEASRQSHYLWHFHNRFMWGEKSADLLEGTERYQRANMVMHSRNFYPNHLGGYVFDRLDANGVHYWGSKVAAFNAGILMNGIAEDAGAPKRAIMKRWIEATEAGAFSDETRASMMPWRRARWLDEVESGLRWKTGGLQMTVTQDANNRVTGVNFGVKWPGSYVARPWAGFPVRNIAGDALVTTSSREGAGWQGDNVVDGHTSIDRNEIHSGAAQVSEWAADRSDSTPWIELTWDELRKVRAVMLSDRASPDHNVDWGTLTMDGGTSISGNLEQRGNYLQWRVSDVETESVRFSINSSTGTPGLAEMVVLGPDPDFKGHLTGNATVISPSALSNAERLFDGEIDASANDATVELGNGRQSLIIDLGDTYQVDGLNVWRFHRDDDRRYRDVVYQLSTVPDFGSDVTTVFSNDGDNSAGQGAGSDSTYPERRLGHPVYFPPVTARYVRLWSAGNNVFGSSNPYVEVEAYGLKNVAAGATPTTDGTAVDLGRITDGNYRGGGTSFVDIGSGGKYVQIDLGSSQWVDSLRVWHYFGDKRRYHDVIFQLSNDSTFRRNVATVFNNDLDGSAGLGAGSDGEYDETPTGKIVHFAPVHARYVRLHSNGNTTNAHNHYTEVMVGQGSTSRGALPPADTAPPLLDSATVAGVTVTLTYDEPLDASSVPAANAFAVRSGSSRNPVTHAVDTVTVSGATVTLTLASAVANGAAATVSYTVPSGGAAKIQDAAGNVAAALVNRALADSAPPLLESATVTGNRLVLTYSEALDTGSAPAASDYAVRANGAAAPLAASGAVAVAGRAVTLVLAEAVALADAVAVDYRPGASPVRDVAGNPAAALRDVAVDNNTAPPAAPSVPAITTTASLPARSAFAVTIEFGDPVAGFDAGDVQVANGAASGFAGSGASYSVSVAPFAGLEGHVTVTVPAGAAARIADGVPSAAGSASFAVDTLAPALETAAVVGDTLTLTYSEAVDASSTPAVADYAVRANGAAAPLAASGAVAVAGRAVTLLLAEAVASADAVAVDYRPGASPVRDVAGNPAAALSDRTVANNTPPPLEVTIATSADLPARLAFAVTIEFGDPVAGFDAGDVQVANGAASGFAGSGASYSVSVAPFVGLEGHVVVTVPAGAAARVADGVPSAAGSSSFAVDTLAPALETAAVAGDTLTLVYGEALDAGSVPSASDYSVRAGGVVAPLAPGAGAVAVSGTAVALALAAAVDRSVPVAVDYSPGASPLRDFVGNEASAFSDRAVANNTAQSDDHGDSRGSATPVAPTSTTEGYLERNDEDYFRIDLPAAGVLVLESASGLDTVGRLEDSGGVRIATDNNRGDGKNFRIVQDLEPGVYYLLVRGRKGAFGAYVLKAAFTPAADHGDPPGDDHGDSRGSATPVAPTSTTEGYLERNDKDYFRIDLPAAGVLVLESASGLDTVGRLEDSGGVRIATDNNRGDGKNFRIVQDLEPGVYYLLVRGRRGAFGAYVLKAAFNRMMPETENGMRVRASNGEGAGAWSEAKLASPLSPCIHGERRLIRIVSISDASAREGEPVRFKVAMDRGRHCQDTSFWIMTYSGTATKDTDYAGSKHHLVHLKANDTETIFEVPTIRDDMVEGDETFWVRIRVADGQGGHTIMARDTAIGVIRDADGPTRRIPYLPPAQDEKGVGFVRIVNLGADAAEVDVIAIDDGGAFYKAGQLEVAPGTAFRFSSAELEDGDPKHDQFGGIGPGQGDWRLDLHAGEAEIEAGAYWRAADGTLSSLHSLVPHAESPAGDIPPNVANYQVPVLNSGKNIDHVGLLRLVNPGEQIATVTITGTNDAGETRGSVEFALRGGESRTVSAADLESGTAGDGRLEEGVGKWRLLVTSDRPLLVLSLLEGPAGQLSNLSTMRGDLRPMPDATAFGERFMHRVLLFPKAGNAENWEGVVRVVNHGEEDHQVMIYAEDESDRTYEPIALRVDAGQAINFNSEDLEGGNASIGLSGIGSGEGHWRLNLASSPDIDVLYYVRMVGGLLAVMDGLVPDAPNGQIVPIFNPGTNVYQRSILHLVNTGLETVSVAITGVDDRGNAGGKVNLSLPGGASRMVTARELEFGGAGLDGHLGEGEGKWRLIVETDRPVYVQNLMKSGTGALTNLSTVSR